MNRPPAFQFYPRDWLGSQRVQLLSLEEEGAYLRLLAYCWLHGSIPADEEQAKQLVGKRAMNLDIAKVLAMFHKNRDGSLGHERLKAEKRKQTEWRKKASEGGKLGAKVRWQSVDKQEKPKGLPLNSDNYNMALQSAVCSLQSADCIYQSYPRHVGHAAALKAIRAKAALVPSEKLLERTQAYALAVSRWPPDERQFIPHPATWFNQERYDDDPQTWERKNGADTDRKRNSRWFKQSGDYSGIRNKTSDGVDANSGRPQPIPQKSSG